MCERGKVVIAFLDVMATSWPFFSLVNMVAQAVKNVADLLTGTRLVLFPGRHQGCLKNSLFGCRSCQDVIFDRSAVDKL